MERSSFSGDESSGCQSYRHLQIQTNKSVRILFFFLPELSTYFPSIFLFPRKKQSKALYSDGAHVSYSDLLINRKQRGHDSFKSHQKKTKTYMPQIVDDKAPTAMGFGLWASKAARILKGRAVLD